MTDLLRDPGARFGVEDALPTALKGDAKLAERLKATAVALFKARGYAGVTVEDIVTDVGVTKGAFYHHFDSKGELLFMLHNEFVSYSVERFRTVMAAVDEPGERLDAFIGEVFRQIHDFRDYVGVLFDERRHLPEARVVEVEAKKDLLRELLEELIADGISRGRFASVNPQTTALAIFGMCMWGYQWYRPDGELSSEELAAQFSALVHRGLDIP